MSQFWKDKRVLVGGGCGFLGSYMVPRLVRYGAKVTILDNFDNSSADSLAEISGSVELVEADLRDSETCAEWSVNRDVVINLAARAFGMEYGKAHHGEMLTYNLLSTLPLLEACRQNNVERYTVVSSSCVYPDQPPIPTPELDAFTGRPETVNQGYGWAKRVQELAGMYYAEEHDMKITIVRPYNFYGAHYKWPSKERAHVIPLLVKRVLDGEDPLVVWGSGNQKRNFLHADDVAELILRIITKDVVATPVNVGYDDDTSIRELVETICEVAGKSPKVVYDTNKPEGSFRKCADPSRLREITEGYVPKISLREGLAEMIEWYNIRFGKGT